MNWYSVIGIALSPFMALLLVFLFARPVRNLAAKYLPDSRLKRILFFSWRV